MELDGDFNKLIANLTSDILAPMKLPEEDSLRLGGNIERAMKKLVGAIIEKAREPKVNT
jgi:hypothetical protein